MRKDIIDEIMKVVNEQIKIGGYDLVLDKSGMSMGQIPVLIHSRTDMDFTPAVIAALNKNAPKTQATPAN
jgi:Skp family chaperone for outer membrane proteins